MFEQKPVRLLIVDNHRQVRDALKLLLSTFDHLEIVGLAGNGEEAVSRCAQLQPDVVLMEIGMPALDGLTATARVRADFPKIQVVALTSFADEALIQRTIDAGARVCIQKDVSVGVLVKAIKAAYQECVPP